jgi:hypothetical protein
MSTSFETTKLWTRTLAPLNPDDGHNGAREKLRAAYLSMRERVAPLVEQAHHDCPGLTIHNVTHLDALWEMADVIAGGAYPLNPLEAFIFGASALLHDAGMALVAFEGRLVEVKTTTAWKETVAGILRLNGEEVTQAAIENPSQQILPLAIFATLRQLHAEKAEELATQKWRVQGSEDPIYLLDDRDLRDFYGKRIGRIAHSHHWSTEKIEAEFSKEVAVLPALPSEWQLNEIKVACLLRCADAAHIDQRRAPTIILALMQPTGLSAIHWGFQNKIGRPIPSNDMLVYSSGQDFGKSEAAQWWLCYDTAKMIDREIRMSNALLEELNIPRLAISSVRGAESPKLFARDVKPTGWEPVNAEVTVSDPIHLAVTLGGRNLYGSNDFAPIRELIQNALDAVRARRRLRGGELSFGKIRIALEKRDGGGGEQQIWLHVDDNGLGMTERVLTSTLIDFGKSIWSSPTLSEEYPGVQMAGVKPIGKFGIGFFSVFLLGNEVRVVSKRWDAGNADTRVLEFDSLSNRPLLRRSEFGELPEDYNTRVSVRLEKADFAVPRPRPEFSKRSVRRLSNSEWSDFGAQLKRLVSATNVRVEFSDGLGHRSFVHDENWEKAAPEVFLSEFLATLSEDTQKRLIQLYSSSLAPIDGGNPDNRGRAAINVITDLRSANAGLSYAYKNVGGLVTSHYLSSDETFYFGVMPADTNDASRRGAKLAVDRDTLSAWMTQQVESLQKSRFTEDELVGIAHTALRHGAKTGLLPIARLAGRKVTQTELTDYIRKNGTVHLRVTATVRNRFSWLGLSGLATMDFTEEQVPGVLVFPASDGGDIFEEGFESPVEGPLVLTGNEPGFSHQRIQPLVSMLESEWGAFSATLQRVQIYRTDFVLGSDKGWVITCKRAEK